MNLRKVQNEKGVTIVALAIIIVILIILAGVTINATIGEGGLIKQAQYASEQMANSTAYEQEQLNKLTGELVNITEGGEVEPPDIIPDYTITIGEPEWAGDGTASVTVSTSESEYILQYQINGTDEGGWQTVQGGKVTGLQSGDTVYTRITDGESSSSIQGKLIQDVTAPERANIQLNKESLTAGESLTATVTHIDNQSGVEITQSKWIMNTEAGNIGTNESSYTGTFTSNGETITLDSSKTGEYYLHVLTVDKAGNRTETISNKITIGGIIGSITQKGDTTWSGGKATVELETGDSGYDIEYKINDGEWTKYEGPIGNLNHGDKITARLTNDVTVGDEIVIDVKDEKGPVVAITPGGTTTESVTVNVVADDMETGMSDTVTYTYYIKETSQPEESYTAPDDAQNITTNSYTFTGLTQGTSYDVKVEVKSDKAGNTGIGTLSNQRTENVPGAGDNLEEGNIVASKPEWSNEKASITLTTSVEGMQIQYQVGGITEGSWQTITSGGKVNNLVHGDTVYARLTDGTNYGDYASVAILDGEAPENATIQLNTDNLVVGSSLTATVTHTDNQSGVEITQSKWVMNTNSGEIGTEPTSYAGTFTSNGETITLDSNTTGEYYLHVLTVDKAGNKKETISSKITIRGVEGTISQKGQTTWSDGKASIELEAGETEFYIEYKVNEGEWTRYEGPIGNLNHGDKITARLTNGTTAGEEVVINVTDDKAPVVTVTPGGTTTNSVTVSASAVDNESGMADNVTYTYYIKETGQPDSEYNTPGNASNISANSYTFTGLEQGKSYDVKVEVQGDKAGNKGTGTLPNQKTGTVPGGETGVEQGAITFGGATWSGGKASITISTNTEMQIEYQINTAIEEQWKEIDNGGTVGELEHGDTVYARLTDGTNYGDYASVAILDGEAPENATIELNTENLVAGESLTARVTQTDNQSGVEITQSKWVMNTNSGNIGTDESSYTGTFTSNGETITLNSNTTGEYYLHVLTVDKAGNKKETISNKITINAITGTVTQKGETTWSDGKASIELETTQTQFTIEYKINEGNWQDYTGAIQNLNHGDKVTARLTNKTVQGPETEITVTDTVNPTVLVTSGGTTTNSVVVNVVASDNESGMADNVTYTYYIKQTSQGEGSYTAPSNAQNITGTTYTFTGLTQGTSYDVKVEATGDKAGNVGTGTLANQQTSTIQGPSEGLEEGNIVASDPIWQNEKASITLTTSVEGMQIQYQVGAIEEEGWTTIESGGTVGNLLHGNTVYARLYDGTNYGDYASVTILDGIAPTVSVSQGEVRSSSITVNITANDGQSGLATTGTYKYYINDSLEATTETNAYTFSGLTPETEYTIKVEAVDKANNTGSNTITVTTKSVTVSDAIDDGTKFEETTPIKDDLDNTVYIPGGFHLAGDSATKVEGGIVIEDDSGNQFVWIPTGEYNVTNKVDSDGTKDGKMTNELSRRTFTSSEATLVSGDSKIETYYYGEGDSRSDASGQIGEFIDSAKPVAEGGKGGFYIGRYEQGDGNVCKGGVNVYTNVTKNTAKSEAEAMYSGRSEIKATSQLISSYAWDTALNFICQTNSPGYILATTTSRTYGNIKSDLGTSNKKQTGEYPADNYSNIHDLLGNCNEWTTEYCSNVFLPYLYRGGYYDSSNSYAASRNNNVMNHKRCLYGLQTSALYNTSNSRRCKKQRNNI